MSNDYLNLTEAPTLVFRAPYCSACTEDCDSDSDGYTCPGCGTCWGHDQFDEPGTLYADWSGESAGGPTVTPDEAWHVSHLDAERRIEKLAAMRSRDPR